MPESPKLLTGGNPQIAKGHGEGPVAAYIAAMPGWKSGLGARLDAILSAELPGLRKAVKWNTPLYGMQENHWFLGFNCLTKAVKLTFFEGARLTPPPPIGSKMPEVRYWSLAEDEALDEALFTSWIRQAAALPGVKL